MSELMGGGSLDTSSVFWDDGFDGGGEVTSWELLTLTLDSLDDGDGEQLLVDSSVEIEDEVDLFGGLLLGGVDGMSLLPEELSRSDEWSWVFELPSDDVGPLIDL